ncbi:Thioredoxin domain-containing protein [Plasmodiophora brassicae]
MVASIEQKVVRIGDLAPDCIAQTTQGEIGFHKYIEGKWACLFSHPKDFTPVCTTELGRVAKLQDEFAKRGVQVVALSCDDVDSHKKWIKDIESSQNCTVNYPIIADADRKIAALWGMLDQTNRDPDGAPLTVRGVFIIGPDKLVKAMIAYPAATGRNFDEILRLIDSCQLTSRAKVATPANWKPGDKCIVSPSLSDDVAKKTLGDFETKLPYLREVKCPRPEA